MYLENEGNYLSVDITGEISYRRDGVSAPEIDAVWNKIEPVHEDLAIRPASIMDKDGFYLVSEKYRLALDYNPRLHGEKIYGKAFTPHVEVHTLWKVTDSNEIYTLDEQGDKRYLWSLTGEVFVTPDEQVAEHFVPISINVKDGGDENLKNYKIYIFIWFTVILAALFILFVR